jgi:DNA-directed RNA polymerase subunit beta
MKNSNPYVTSLPNFIEIQKVSFYWFLTQGLKEEFDNFSLTTDLDTNFEIFIFGNEYKLTNPKFNEFESKQKEDTYSTKIYVPVEVQKTKIDQIVRNKIKNIFIGILPLMTNKASFIFNGCERVIINQIVKSPGIYFQKSKNKSLYTALLISNKGSWLNFELQDSSVNVSINKFFKLNVFDIFKELSLTDKEIYQTLKYPNFLINKFININEHGPENSLILGISKIFNSNSYSMGRVGRLKLNERLHLDVPEETHDFTYSDLIAIIDSLIFINFKGGITNDVDHLENKKVRSVGELLQLQFRLGLNRLEQKIKRQINLNELKFSENNLIVTEENLPYYKSLINPLPLIATIKEFFGSSQLAQFMDQINPLASLTHKRRISALGPGGLDQSRISFKARDIHPSHYGRICPIETPEGPNAGVVVSLATCARINSYGFIETPFWKVKNGRIIKNNLPIYLTADAEDRFKIAPADLSTDENCLIKDKSVTIRYNQDFISIPPFEIDLIAISTIQIVSIGASLIPFFEHDDANRALMGSNMQRQSVPLLFPQKPIVGTGLETQIAIDSGMLIVAFKAGIVRYVSSKKIIINQIDGTQMLYELEKYVRTNQKTCINHRPIVWVGEIIQSGQILADGPSTDNGELALGQNITVAYMPWEGYNFEDAILINERLIYEDVFTSIHLEEHEIDVCETDDGIEKTTSDIPFIDKELLLNLDENGIVYVGTFVEPDDILVGKITPKSSQYVPPEVKLLEVIFKTKVNTNYDSSLRVPKIEEGRVLDIKILSLQNGDQLPFHVIYRIKIFLAQIRKIQVGDKISGRHGNKGIISRIMPQEDMPYLPDGKPVDIVLNPLGVPSRMNVGQLYECLLGFAGDKLNRRFKILPFDEIYGQNSSRILINKKLREASLDQNQSWIFNPFAPGKILLSDGRTGKQFENPVTVGKAYMLKLMHLADEKIHARSTGPYNLITQQPLQGRSHHGGQRFGEMEVWALEAFGVSHILQELLTIKSDDINGRDNMTIAIIKGSLMPKPGIPESFKVLLSELKSIGLDISTYKMNHLTYKMNLRQEVDLIENYSFDLDDSYKFLNS